MSPQTLDLEEVSILSRSDSPEKCLFHLFGVFFREEKTQTITYWWLHDASHIGGLRIKLCGSLDQYPKPKPGDIVRIHRSSIDRNTRLPIILSPKNIIVWPSFKHKPVHLTIAKNPTITDEDEIKRRRLEQYFCSTLHKIEEVKAQRVPRGQFVNIAGRVDDIGKDPYGHLLLVVNDGSGTITVRVFAKRNPYDSNAHYEVASELKSGDFIVAISTKIDNQGVKLQLSANTQWGRSLRVVEKASMLGVTLDEALSGQDLPQVNVTEVNNEPQLISSQGSGFSDAPIRRSPRIRELKERQTNQSSPSPPTSSQATTTPQPELPPLPSYTNISDLRIQRDGFFEFHDIAGQVRGEPNETKLYKNWVFQLYDGSSHRFASYYIDEVREPIKDCVTVLVYSKQKETDTDRHIECVKKLQEGDLVIMKNVKVSWRNGKIKLEMNANLVNGKSIEVIDKNSRFGKALLDIVTNPDVEELFYSTPPGDNSMEIDDIHV